MKKGLLARLLALTAALFGALCLNIFAFSPQVRDIDITVALSPDGSAHITQTWDVTVASGTEWYLIQNNMGDMEISNLQVTDENGTVFQDASPWNVDATIDEKREKSGINITDSGYELCWGVGSMGKHTYTVSYNVTNFVKAYSDFSGFNVRLINDELTSAPEHIKVTIVRADGLPFAAEDTAMWAFGFDGGSIYLETDGKIVAESHEPLEYSSHVTIMCRFAPGVFAPTSVRNESFSVLENAALEGSDYTEDNDDAEHGSYVPDAPRSSLSRFFSTIAPFFFLMLGSIIVALLAKAGSNGSISYKVSEKDLPYSREIPYKGDLIKTFSALSSIGKLAEDNSIIGSYLLRWIKAGNVVIEEHEKKGFLGIGGGMEPSIVLRQEPAATGAEQELYSILCRAAGSDGILQSRELQNWSKSHYKTLETWNESAKEQGSQALYSAGEFELVKTRVFFGLFPSDKLMFTAIGKQNIDSALGFKKYLLDFTIINERAPAEVHLWDEYLVFASLFGIADKVAKDFKKLYPAYFEVQQSGVSTFDTYYSLMLINRMSRAVTSGISAAHTAESSRSSGGGGFSSFGGGGGFSGGGSGGGSR